MDIAFSAGDILWYKLTHQIVDTATEKEGLREKVLKPLSPGPPAISMALLSTLLACLKRRSEQTIRPHVVQLYF